MEILQTPMHPETEKLRRYEVEVLKSLHAHTPDWFLRTLVTLANDTGATMPLILTVGGSLVAGTLIGGREYFTLIGKALGVAIGVGEEQGAQMYQSIIDSYYPEKSNPESGAEEGEEEKEERSEPGYIHLRDARVYHGLAQIPTQYAGILWRGRLAAVSGFTLGDMKLKQS